MTRDSGAIYRIDVDGRVSQLTPREFGITNTMAWTDDARFLTADTTRNAIYAYDLRAGVLRTSASSPRLSIEALRRVVPRRQGTPLELPSCRRSLCRLYRARRRARSIRRPALHVADQLRLRWARFRYLYVTSARFMMTAEHIGPHPEEGALFALKVGARGPSRASFQITPKEASSRKLWRIRVQRLRWCMTISFARHQFPPAIIRHAVWLYVRFSLSYRGVEDLLAERGLDISYETVRRWVLKFGRRCHTNLDRRGAGFGRPAELQAAVTARHARNASSLRTRSVRRDVR